METAGEEELDPTWQDLDWYVDPWSRDCEGRLIE